MCYPPHFDPELDRIKDAIKQEEINKILNDVAFDLLDKDKTPDKNKSIQKVLAIIVKSIQYLKLEGKITFSYINDTLPIKKFLEEYILTGERKTFKVLNLEQREFNETKVQSIDIALQQYGIQMLTDLFKNANRFFRNDKKIIESVKEEFVARLIYENPTVILNEADKDYIEKRLQALLAGIIN